MCVCVCVCVCVCACVCVFQGKPAYDERAGQPYPLFSPPFSTEKPNLADMSVGISLYFQLLMKLFFIFICISVLTLPSLCITFSARPTWGDDEQGVGVLKKFSIGAMVRPSSTDAFGCDEDYCTFPTAKSRDSHGAIFVPPVPCRSFQTAEVCTVAEGCDFVASCGGCVNVGSNCVSTASLLALIVWLDLICCLAFVASVCVCMCVCTYICVCLYGLW